MSRTYTLEHRQTVHRPLAEVFDFFSNAENLQRLTPDTLHFQILSRCPIEMRPGAIIDYRLKLLGVPFNWQTVIESFDPPHRFTDVQARGPYRRWHHTHEFSAVPEGTLVVDRVEYEMPFGPLGTIAHALFVRRSLRQIFEFRRQALAQVFPVEMARAAESLAS